MVTFNNETSRTRRGRKFKLGQRFRGPARISWAAWSQRKRYIRRLAHRDSSGSFSTLPRPRRILERRGRSTSQNGTEPALAALLPVRGSFLLSAQKIPGRFGMLPDSMEIWQQAIASPALEPRTSMPRTCSTRRDNSIQGRNERSDSTRILRTTYQGGVRFDY